jgi:hypothetical protein
MKAHEWWDCPHPQGERTSKPPAPSPMPQSTTAACRELVGTVHTLWVNGCSPSVLRRHDATQKRIRDEDPTPKDQPHLNTPYG